MKAKPLIDERLILAAAVFSPTYFIALQLVEKYKIDIGHLGQAVIELVTIPALIMPLFIFGYSLAYMISTKRGTICLLISMICSGLLIGGFVTGLVMGSKI